MRGGGRKRRAAIQIRSLTLVPPSRAVQSRISLGHGVKRVSRPHLRGLTRKRGVNSTINSARVRNQCSTGGGGGRGGRRRERYRTLACASYLFETRPLIYRVTLVNPSEKTFPANIRGKRPRRFAPTSRLPPSLPLAPRRMSLDALLSFTRRCRPSGLSTRVKNDNTLSPPRRPTIQRG